MKKFQNQKRTSDALSYSYIGVPAPAATDIERLQTQNKNDFSRSAATFYRPASSAPVSKRAESQRK